MRFWRLLRKPKVLVLWYPVDENLGDYYLFNTVRNYAINWGYEVDDIDVGAPFDKIVEAARDCDWVWFAGGGIIERGIPDLICNFPSFLKRTKKIKYGVTGLSVGDFDYSDRANEISEWVNNAAFFYTRDDYSAELLNSMASSRKVISSVDVVFASGIVEAERLEHTRCVGVSFRPMPYPDLTGEIAWKDWNDAINNNVEGLIIGIPDQFEVSELLDFSYELGYSPQNAVKEIMRMDYGIAMRYHVILIAAIMGKICIPIDYCPKVARLAKQLGIEELILHYDQPDQLSKVLRMYKENEDVYKETVKTNVEIMKMKAKKMFENVEQIMKESKK